MKKKLLRILAVSLALILAFNCLVFADQTTELQENLTDVQEELTDLNKQLSSGKSQSPALSSQIKSLEKQIYAAEKEINSLEKDINVTKAEITAALEELERLEGEVGTQSDDLNARLRAMYKAGEIGFLSVLLGSSSLSDFMTNMDMVKRIYNSDTELLAELQGEYDAVEAQKQKLLGLKETLVTKQETLETKEASLSTKKTEVSTKKSQVDSDNKELEAQIDALNEEANKLTAEILKLQSNGAYIGGTMCWPSEASTRITSPFGNRLHPILKVYKLHTGIDIGAAGGTNILAANAGTVISACYNSGYGYMVMIDHGGGIVTLYAHSSKLLVKKGDVVSRRQVIALVGSTGNSTGNHLHFEVRVNGVYKNPLDYISTSVRY